MTPELFQFLTNASSPVAVAALVLWFWQRDVRRLSEEAGETRTEERADKLLLIETLRRASETQVQLQSAIHELAGLIRDQRNDG